jgi:hypothetical protein
MPTIFPIGYGTFLKASKKNLGRSPFASEPFFTPAPLNGLRIR